MRADCHMHMLLDGVDYRAAIAGHRGHVQENLVRQRLEAYADAGIEYLRDGGDAFGVAELAARLAPEYGLEYRTPCFPICRKGRYGGFIGRAFDDFDGYRDLVDEVSKGGGDFIKIMISGLMDFDRYGVITSQPLAREEIRDMIAYAHDRGFAVMAHANGADTIRAALDAGVDSIEHGAYMDPECVAQLAESGVVWVPTLVTIANLIGCGRYPDSVLQPLLALQMGNVRRCADLGGTIAAGSDAGAYRVYHVQGCADEERVLAQALGHGAELVMRTGAEAVRRRFVPGING